MNLDELIDVALDNHPAMRVASSNIKAAQSDHRRSLRSRYPNLDLRLATEYGDHIGGLEGNSEETSLVINLTYNLYRGGRNDAEQQQKVSAVHEQKEFAARVRRQVINTLRLSWTADNLLIQQLQFLESHVIKSGQTVESYKEEFFIGQRNLLDLLDAENEYNSAKNQLAEARLDSLAARYRVYEGIGQLFEATGIDFSLTTNGLIIARLDTNLIDTLPIPNDEDADLEVDPLDHCDNSVPASIINSFGCHRDASLPIETALQVENSLPVLGDDKFEIEAGGILVISKSQLLNNDADADSDPMEIVDISQPSVGRLAANQSGDLVYRPAEGFAGVDSFKYTVTDNKTVNVTATVQISVREAENVNLSKLQLVNFIYKSTELTEPSKIQVADIIDGIKSAGEVAIEIYTHTDSIGSESYNIALSQRRAEALKTQLIESGINAEDIKAIGIGERQPIADNSTASGQAINRRGEFIFRAKMAAE